MSDIAFQAVPRSIDTIRSIATAVRDVVGYREVAQVPVGQLVEFDLPKILPSFVYDIRTHAQMGDNEGLASPDYDYIAIREDVYSGAQFGHGRDRFTVAHEIGHLILHQQESLVMRRSAGARPPAIFCRPEWQADTFAAEFLMDHRMIGPDDDEVALTHRFGVSYSAAKKRIHTLRWTGVLPKENEPRRKPGSSKRS